MKKSTQIIELLIDEDAEQFGVDAISLVEHPAIESNWVAFNKEVKLAAIDEEKRILMGAALIPNKQIYRFDQERGDYYVWFSHSTVRKASQLFLQNFKQSNTTLEHDSRLQGQSVVESWIVEDTKKDKTRLYGMDVPKGTWMVSMKVDNEEVWQNYVKAGKVKGFSIEGFFVDNMIEAKEQKFVSYTDYPKAASANAQRAIDYKEANGSDCGTMVGWVRARQLADRKPISRETIARMGSFKRHQQNKGVPYDEGCGGIMWDAWGGDEGIEWAIRKLRVIDGETAMRKNKLCRYGWEHLLPNRSWACGSYSLEEAEKLARRNPDCPDGWEHEMPDGSWMCGKYHRGTYSAQCECGEKPVCDCKDEQKLAAIKRLIKKHLKNKK